MLRNGSVIFSLFLTNFPCFLRFCLTCDRQLSLRSIMAKKYPMAIQNDTGMRKYGIVNTGMSPGTLKTLY